MGARWALGLLVAVAGALVLGTAPAAAAGAVVIEAAADGTSLATATGSHPVRLDPTRPLVIRLTVRNHGRSAVEARSVNFAGRVVGLTFFEYQTAIRLSVTPGRTGAVQFPLDVSGLGDQATGLIPASVTVYDAAHHALGRVGTVVDVRGSPRSVYAVFGMTVALLAVALLVSLLLAVARHRLPGNRWARALRFLPLGAAAGLTAIFTLSAARILVPTAGHWVPVLLALAAVAFIVGYLSPRPGDGAASAPPREPTGGDTRPEPEPVAAVLEPTRSPEPAARETVGVPVTPRATRPRSTATRSSTGSSTRSSRPRSSR